MAPEAGPGLSRWAESAGRARLGAGPSGPRASRRARARATSRRPPEQCSARSRGRPHRPRPRARSPRSARRPPPHAAGRGPARSRPRQRNGPADPVRPGTGPLPEAFEQLLVGHEDPSPGTNGLERDRGQARVGPPTWSPVRSTTAPPKQRSDPTTANTMRPTPGRRTSTDHSRSIPPSGGSPRIPAGRTESRHGHGAEGGPKPPRGAAGRGRPPPWRTRIRRGPSRIGAPGAEEDRSGRGARGSPGKPRLAGGTARATRTGPSDRRARPGLPLTAGDELVSFWFVFKVWTPSSPPDRP